MSKWSRGDIIFTAAFVATVLAFDNYSSILTPRGQQIIGIIALGLWIFAVVEVFRQSRR